jgi:hypothetical protein
MNGFRGRTLKLTSHYNIGLTVATTDNMWELLLYHAHSRCV